MSTSAPEDFAQALAQRLGGQSVRQLAAVSGWGRTTVSDIRAGRHIPSEAQLRDLLMSVGADESEIASWQERRSAIITPPAA
ncbi:MAG: helix-turn-helix domain-containing protein, partial [Tetrasphaera sp.]|nr:helix-turn-helix domain-containing protein [Tetrasphaera sp.]